MNTCTVLDCGRPTRRRDLCEAHYVRQRRHGDVGTAHVGPIPLRERFEAKYVVTPGGCWRWIGTRTPEGYGQIRVAVGEVAYAHRVAYELLVGPIPEGLHIDHLCRVRACVNPAHLEPVTQAENNRRAASVRMAVSA